MTDITNYSKLSWLISKSQTWVYEEKKWKNRVYMYVWQYKNLKLVHVGLEVIQLELLYDLYRMIQVIR